MHVSIGEWRDANNAMFQTAFVVNLVLIEKILASSSFSLRKQLRQNLHHLILSDTPLTDTLSGSACDAAGPVGEWMGNALASLRFTSNRGVPCNTSRDTDQLHAGSASVSHPTSEHAVCITYSRPKLHPIVPVATRRQSSCSTQGNTQSAHMGFCQESRNESISLNFEPAQSTITRSCRFPEFPPCTVVEMETSHSLEQAFQLFNLTLPSCQPERVMSNPG
jgi:hypothetical protein